MDLLNPSWENPEREHQPRPFIVGKLTGLTQLEQRLVIPDMRSISNAVQEWAADNDCVWDPINAHDVFHPDRPEVEAASDVTLLEVNEHCLASSDALIVHGFADGSIMLGWLLRSALSRFPLMPVLLLAHHNESLSRPLRGLEARYDSFTIESFDDQMEAMRHTRDWLDDQAPLIQRGPDRREAVRDMWGARAQEVADLWMKATGPTRAAVIAETGITAMRIETFLERPALLGELPAHIFGAALSILDGDVRHRVLDDLEVEAWEFWARDKGPDYAQAVLDAAIKERCDGKVARTAAHLGQPAAWDRFTAKWQRLAPGPDAG